MRLVQKIVFIFLCIAALAVALYIIQSELERSSAILAIPENILIDELILSDYRSDLRESCGVTIFKLSKLTLEQIEHRGLEFFSKSTTGRDNGKYYRYNRWIQTRVSTPKVNVLRGLNCVKIDGGIVSVLWEAAELQGSYIGIGYEYDLLIVPRLGFIVSSIDG